MMGEQRLAIALELHELSCDVTREGIRQQYPSVDEVEVERLLRQRLTLVNSEKQIAELAVARKLVRTPKNKLRS